MKQYHDLVRTVLKEGIRKENRTGIDTISYFAYPMRFDLAEGFPLMTTKRMAWKTIIHELLWFIKGDTNIKYLQDNNVKIWNEWADENGEVDAAYGRWWRRFPYARKTYDKNFSTHTLEEFDQIGQIIKELKCNPNSRRLVLSAWHPTYAWKAKLPPCHVMAIFNVQDGKLCCHLTQRSCDILLGIPFNIASYAALTQIIAQEVGLELGIFSHMLVDAHIYTSKPDGSMAEYDHIPGAIEQISREPLKLPKLVIANKPIDDLTIEDFELVDYIHHDKISFKVAV